MAGPPPRPRPTRRWSQRRIAGRRKPRRARSLRRPRARRRNRLRAPHRRRAWRRKNPIAAPAVRRRAWELGIPLQSLSGSGPGGRILHEDLDAYIVAGGHRGAAPVPAAATATAERHGVEEIRIIGLRRRIAERLQDVQWRIPHFSCIEEVDVTALEELRRHLNADLGTTSVRESRGKQEVREWEVRLRGERSVSLAVIAFASGRER